MAPNTSLTENGSRYLYAVIEETSAQQYDRLGINDEHVYAITNGTISAVVSNGPVTNRIRPERRHLKAHKEILNRLMEETTPLPMAFGIIAEDSMAVENILSKNQNILVEQLERVNGKVEMGLRVTLNTPNVFEYFIKTHPELRASRDRFFGTSREPSPESKIELGQMFDSILTDDRASFTEQVEDAMASYCLETKQNKCRNEREVMNLVFLVGRDAESEFEKGILKAAGFFDDNFSFDYNGPWAPHNFVDLDLSF